MSELKPCPFCGRDLNEFPLFMIVQKRRINPNDFKITCIQCGAVSGAGWSEKEAIEKWNTRHY